MRDSFDAQHRELKGLTVDERVPVPDEPGVTVSYRFLIELEEEGEQWCRPEGSRHRVRVADLLNGVDSSERRAKRLEPEKLERRESIVSKKNVFLSYCLDNAAEV